MAKENEIVNENTAQGETREKRFVSPAVDIRESASAYLVTADVPGAQNPKTPKPQNPILN